MMEAFFNDVAMQDDFSSNNTRMMHIQDFDENKFNIELETIQLKIEYCLISFKKIATPIEETHLDFENINNDIIKFSEKYNGIYAEIELIKKQLIDGPLKSWHLLQQKLSIDHSSYDVYLNDLLNSISRVFRTFFKTMDKIINGLFDIKKACLIKLQEERTQYNDYIFKQKEHCMDSYIEKFNNLLNSVYEHAIVVVKQPRQIVTLVKMDTTKKSDQKGEEIPKSKFSFNSDIRILGIELNQKDDMNNKISEIQSKDAWNLVFYNNKKITSFKTSSNSDIFYYDKSTGIVSFKNITIYRHTREKDEQRRSHIKDLRYALHYNIPIFRLIGRPPFERKFSKLSLPFSLITEGKPDIELETRMFVERAFIDLTQPNQHERLLSEKSLSQLVQWEQVKFALRIKFEAVIKEKLKNINVNFDRNKWRELSDMNFTYLKQKFTKYSHDAISNCLSENSTKNADWQCQCYQCKNNLIGSQAISEEELHIGTLLEHVVAIRTTPRGYRPCTFLSWFFTICEMIGVLGELWNNEQILFYDRITAENYLMQSSEPSIIIRFADTDQGLIRVVIRGFNTRPIHHIAYYKPMVDGLNINPEDTFSTCEELKTIVFNYADVINALKGDKIRDPYTSKLHVRIAVSTRPNPIIIERFVDDPEWYANKCGIKDAKINTVLIRLPWRNEFV